MKRNKYINHMRTRAIGGSATYRVVAVGLTTKNEVVGITVNKPARNIYFPYYHAECQLMHRYGKNISRILIARFNKHGKQLPIEPCSMCKSLADRLGIKIEKLEIAI